MYGYYNFKETEHHNEDFYTRTAVKWLWILIKMFFFSYKSYICSRIYIE